VIRFLAGIVVPEQMEQRAAGPFDVVGLESDGLPDRQVADCLARCDPVQPEAAAGQHDHDQPAIGVERNESCGFCRI